MLSLLILVAAAAALWRFGYWPFDRSYKMVPQYSEWSRQKAAPPPVIKRGP